MNAMCLYSTPATPNRMPCVSHASLVYRSSDAEHIIVGYIYIYIDRSLPAWDWETCVSQLWIVQGFSNLI